MNICSLDFDTFRLTGGDYTNSDFWIEKIIESGHCSSATEYMIFSDDRHDIVVDYELIVDGKILHYDGDYWTPSHTEVNFTDVIVNITDVHIDDCKVELTKDFNDALQIEIKKYI